MSRFPVYLTMAIAGGPLFACATAPGGSAGLAEGALVQAWQGASPGCDDITILANGATIIETSRGCGGLHGEPMSELRLRLVVAPEPSDEPAALEGISAIVATLALEGDHRSDAGERLGIQREALAHGFVLDAVADADGIGWQASLPYDATASSLELAALALVRLASETTFSSNHLATWAERNRTAAPRGGDLPGLWATALAGGHGRLLSPPGLGPTIAILNREDLVRQHRRLFTAARIRLSLPKSARGDALLAAVAALPTSAAADPVDSPCIAPRGRLFVTTSHGTKPTWLAIPIDALGLEQRAPPLEAVPAALRDLIAVFTRQGSPLRAHVVRVGQRYVFAVAEPDLAPLLAFVAALRQEVPAAARLSPSELAAIEALIHSVSRGIAVRTIDSSDAATPLSPDELLLEGGGCLGPEPSQNTALHWRAASEITLQ